MKADAVTLVFAPNQAGERFVESLCENHIPYAVVSCHQVPEMQVTAAKLMENEVKVHIKEEGWQEPPEMEFDKVYLFEEQTAECCRLLIAIRRLTSAPIYVITKRHHPQMLYRSIGAQYVIRTNSDDVLFLIEYHKEILKEE
ncbi:hypothetical protein D3C74_56820 [compost metagenome]